MIDALKYEDMLKTIEIKNGKNRKAIGILLGHPNDSFVRDNILNKIDYYHKRSRENINFYFPGYGAYWNDCYPDAVDVCTIDYTKWSFSNARYCEFIDVLEKNSKWQYSGETELLIVDYFNGTLDFQNMMVCWLDRMVADKVVYSPANFFETIFRNFKTEKTTYDFSDCMSFDRVKETIVDLIKQSAPFQLGKIFDDTQYFITRNYCK